MSPTIRLLSARSMRSSTSSLSSRIAIRTSYGVELTMISLCIEFHSVPLRLRHGRMDAAAAERALPRGNVGHLEVVDSRSVERVLEHHGVPEKDQRWRAAHRGASPSFRARKRSGSSDLQCATNFGSCVRYGLRRLAARA